MSKKMMKRSLALGALMAFVITGSAWANDLDGWSWSQDDWLYTVDSSSNSEGIIPKGEYNGVMFVGEGVVSVGDGVEVCSSDDGYGGILGSFTGSGVVNITGGTIIDNPMNMYVVVAGLVNNNIVNISGGKVVGNVCAALATGEAKNNIVNISGKANVEEAGLYGYYDASEGNLAASGNTLNITGWKGSESEADNGYGTIGSAQNFNAINIIEGSSVSFKTALNDNDVVVNVKGATWNVDKANTVGSAYFDATSTLKIDGATFANNDGENSNYALNGNGNGTLTVEQGAKLKIEGIKETTYNIAQNFTNLKEAAGKWEVSDINTLMQGVAWTSEEGLQVEVFAKKAEDIAEDMGVSVNVANTMTDIITAANENKNIKPGTPQADVVEFANALADAAPEVAGQAVEAVVKMAEEVGQSAIAASIVKNVTDITNDRLSFNCGHSAPQKGGHGVGLLEEGSGADVWVEYVHGKDEVENMKSTAGATSYEGQYNGFVMGVDFKKVNKFQSGIAFNYGEGDTNSVGSLTRTHSDYDFWGVGYYGNIHNDDSNVIFDINYAKTDSDVTQKNLTGDIEASPEATTWTAGVKVEKLYQNENVRIVPYTGLRYMSIDADDYSTKCGTYNYKMERKDIWLLPVGVSIKQEVTNDNGWTVSPRVDLSYIWAFGDTDSNMGFGHALDNKITNIGYDVMDDGSFLGLVGIEAHKGQWGYGVAYSYQKGDHSESKKWYVDVNYSF